jgi:hypothetical protein
MTHFSDDEIQMIENMKPFKIYLKGNPLQCLCPSLRFLKWMKQSHIIADVDVLRCVQEDGSSQDIVNRKINPVFPVVFHLQTMEKLTSYYVIDLILSMLQVDA